MPAQVYLDYQSSKPVDPRVVDAMRPWFTESFGNPSSLHLDGDEATDTLERSRERVAQFIGANKDEVIFTSGATESNNLAMIGYATRNRRRGDHIVVAESEHISIHNIAKALEKQGFKVSKVGVDQYGRVSVEKLRKKINDATILVSIGWASSEIGTVQPMPEIADALQGRGIALHTDAVAAEGLVPIDVRKVHVDLLTLSANDIYGPKGLGALYIRRNVNIAPVMPGGGQERGLRSGTENMPAIVGMAAAADIMTSEMPAEALRLMQYRDRLIAGVLGRIPKSHLNGHPRERLPNNAHFRFEAIEGESLLLSLKDKGVAASTGSACSSKTLEPSHTLISCGLLHEEAHGSLEFTFGRWSRPTDVDRVIEVLPGIVERLRSLSPLYAKETKA
ncbi:MAG: cysteine desulfurase NifS [Deltaproteobacteria bacterium RBG_16_58_17]|nr:MAG: cysteine desulfurase NifS [Deltaproteobacteria bacterium RBG_16_58_17]OHE16293.1 MAG: cysteine desulfurase NifS [Syntrophobacterales bacterium GWC2_56_13]